MNNEDDQKKPIELTVEQWLSVRQFVADELKKQGSSQQTPTRITIAENLMQAGIIDIPAVCEKIAERLSRRLEAEEEHDG